MSASTLKTYIKVNYAEKIDKIKTDGVEADAVLEPLLKIMAEGQVLDSKEEMASHLRSDKVTKFNLQLMARIYERQCNVQKIHLFTYLYPITR